MAGQLAILCPGQGGQHARMFDLAFSDAQASALLERWSLEPVLGMPLSTALADHAALFSNRVAQPLIVAAACAAWEVVRARIPAPALVAGYSIGELSAYAVAGSIATEEAIALASCRARMMDACVAPSLKQQLMAVSGVSISRLRDMLQSDSLFIAIETGEDSAIVGGEKSSAEALSDKLLEMGCRISVLPVEVASHTPYMREAANAFLEELRRHPFASPAFPVMSGLSGRLVYRADEAQATLAGQIADRIRWMDCMDACAEAGITIALELGPGSALSRMLRERHPHIECRSIDEFRTVEGVARWVDRHCD